MTAAQTYPLTDARINLADGVSPTPHQRAWLDALLKLTGADRVRRVDVEPALSSRYSLVVGAQYGAARDREYVTWTLSSAGTADIW